MQEDNPLNVVRAWVNRVRRRLSSEGSDRNDEKNIDWGKDMAWLSAGGETDIGEASGEDTACLLDSDPEEPGKRAFGPLELGGPDKPRYRGRRRSTPSEPTQLDSKWWNRNIIKGSQQAEVSSPGVLSPHSHLSDYKSAQSNQSDSYESLATIDLLDDSSDDSDDLSSLSSYDTVENALSVIVESLSVKQRALLDFSQLFEPWRDRRTLTLHTLRSLADDLEHHRLNVNISVVTGSSVGATGGVLAIIGLALAPETFGVSLILTAVGTAASVAGGVTSLGSNIADCVITSKRVKIAQAALDEDTLLTKDIHGIVKKLLKSTARLEYTVKILPNLQKQAPARSPSLTKEEIRELQDLTLPDGRIDGKPDATTLATSCVQVTAAEVGAVGALEQGIARAVVSAAEDSSVGISVAARAAGITFSALAVGLDIYKIVTTSLALAGGSESEAATRLRQIANDLEQELTRMTTFYDRACGQVEASTPDSSIPPPPSSLIWEEFPDSSEDETVQPTTLLEMVSKPSRTTVQEVEADSLMGTDGPLFYSEGENEMPSTEMSRQSSIAENTLAAQINCPDTIQDFVDTTYRISY